MSKPLSNPKSDTAESAALALFLGATVYAYTPTRGMTARRGGSGSKGIDQNGSIFNGMTLNPLKTGRYWDFLACNYCPVAP